MLAVLGHRSDAAVTALRELIDRASTPAWMVSATGAIFDVKELLKGRGYRWMAESSVWSREVGEDELQVERAWLAENVYHPSHRPKADVPTVTAVTWTTRYA